VSVSGSAAVVVELYSNINISFFVRVGVNSCFAEYTFTFVGLRRIIGHVELRKKNTTDGCARGVNWHLAAVQMVVCTKNKFDSEGMPRYRFAPWIA
jgi:hypothetical protein